VEARRQAKSEVKLADKPGSVLALRRVTVIHLGAQLLMRSSNLPAGSASHANTSLFGLAPDGGYRVSRPPCGILVSVALFLASRRTAVSRHPALRSPDFPLSLQGDRKGLPQFIMAINCQIKCDSDCLASFMVYSSTDAYPKRHNHPVCIFHEISCPARKGTNSPSAIGMVSGTFQLSLRKVTLSVFLGKP
jgi:hypothetical protein